MYMYSNLYEKHSQKVTRKFNLHIYNIFLLLDNNFYSIMKAIRLKIYLNFFSLLVVYHERFIQTSS